MRFSQRELRSFIGLALRHACHVDDESQVEVCLGLLGSMPHDEEIAHVIAEVGSAAALDRIRQLLNDSVTVRRAMHPR
jgi:hypothetical protein